MTDLANWTPRPRPSNAAMQGRHVTIEPWNAARHGDALWNAFGGTAANDLLFHFGWPRMHSAEDLSRIIDGFNDRREFSTCVFCSPDGRPLGMASYLRFDEKNGVVEVGAVGHGEGLARTPAATEAHYLMARRAFDECGYRRYEWKLNNPNEASHRAARRFGFTFEGVFRNHQVMAYGNRDTAWYSIIDREWPRVRAAFEAWLSPENFDAHGRQGRTLEEMRESLP